MTGEQCVQGTEAETFRILEWTTNQVVKVRLNREDWYLQVPMLDENQSQAIDFSSGLMAYFRGDWNLVLSRMAKILETRRGVELKTDARVYRGAAKYRLGFSGEDEFRLAEELSPFNAQVAQYRVVGLLLDAIRASPSSRQRIVLGAMSYIKRKEKLFSSDDPWLSSARALAELLVASP